MDRTEARLRAEELVQKMTVEERISQLRYNAPAIERLGIPAYNWWNEALHGVARAGQATSFPQAIGMAASFDEELIEEIAGVIAEEGRAKYNALSEYGDRDIYKGLTFWSPNINIFRDPRWGRGQETYGEDPYLSGTLGCAFVRGLQGDGEYMKAAACAKHFAVHSGPEAIRHSFDAVVSQKDLYETYLPAFERLVREAKVEAVMGAYNRVNGEPACAMGLIADPLRTEWGFEGHVVSDCWAIQDFHLHHKVTATPEESAAMAMNAGCDLNCGSTFLHLLDAYRAGMVSEERVTEACTRLYTTRFLLGLFDETEYDDIPYTVVECPEHLALAERAARESIILLKNNGILPLDVNHVKTIGVIGPNANSRAALVGNYHGTATEYITPLDGILRYIQEHAENPVRVLFSEGCDIRDDRIEKLAEANDRLAEAQIVAEASDVVVLVVGLNETLEGEEGDTGNSYASGDKTDLLLPAPQRDLLKAVCETGKPVILCLIAGSAIDLSYADQHCAAVLQLWYPGARGGKALAEILFGKESPSGKLCVTFYRDTDPLPDFTDYSMKGRTYRYLAHEPLYPFGYGLTYGDISVKEASLAGGAQGGTSACKAGGGMIRALCRNDGQRACSDVVQVYIACPRSPYAPPNPRLIGFARVTLAPGEEKEVTIKLDPHAREVIDDEGRRVSGGTVFEYYIGTSQPDALSAALTGHRPVRLEA